MESGVWRVECKHRFTLHTPLFTLHVFRNGREIDMAPVIQTPSHPPQVALPRVLVVDDEPGLIELVSDVVKRSHNCRLISASTVAQAEKIITSERIDLLIADVHLPDGNGMALLPKLAEKHPLAASVIITGNPSINSTISAFR